MQEKIRAACAKGRIQWRKHALERMMERSISRDHVKQVLMKGDVIASYHDDKPFPSLLLDGRFESEALHVVVALNEIENQCYIITAYRPDRTHFESDLKTRRKS